MEIAINKFLPIANLVNAASEDATRYQLQCVRFDPKTGKGTATNGYILAETSIECSEEFAASDLKDPILIDRDACKAILKNKGFCTVVLSKEKITIKNGHIHEYLNVDAQFPDTDAIKPKWEPSFEIALDAKLLLALAESIRDLDRPNNKRSIGIKIKGNGDKFSPLIVERGNASGVIMPMRM